LAALVTRDFQICRIAELPACGPLKIPPDPPQPGGRRLKIGDTADWKVGATLAIDLPTRAVPAGSHDRAADVRLWEHAVHLIATGWLRGENRIANFFSRFPRFAVQPYHARMSMNCWLVKQEPESYSWATFAKEGKTAWTGVRN